MTLQCLPEIIRESLRTIIGERNFSSGVTVSITGSANTKISSSCNLRASEGGRELELFVKYLGDAGGGFGREAASYFGNEVAFYADVLVMFEKAVTGATGKQERLTFAPACLAVGNTLTRQPFIIMEDLLAGGYTPMDIRKPLSAEQARAVLDQLGRFHAFSFCAKAKYPELFRRATSKLQETVFREETRGTVGKLFVRSIHDVYKLTKQSFPAGSEYVETFADFTMNIFDKMIAWVTGDEEDAAYKVLTHGDLWPTNILCKFASGSTNLPENVAFIDYQTCRLSSPAHDLQLFLLIALDKATRDRSRPDLIRHYHTSLCRTLQYLGCDPLMLFPYSALQNQMRKQSTFALAVALTGLPLFLAEDATCKSDSACRDGTNDADMLIDFINNVQLKKSMRCKSKMLEIVVDVVDQGYL